MNFFERNSVTITLALTAISVSAVFSVIFVDFPLF